MKNYLQGVSKDSPGTLIKIEGQIAKTLRDAKAIEVPPVVTDCEEYGCGSISVD